MIIIKWNSSGPIPSYENFFFRRVKYCNYLHIRRITSKVKAEIKNSTSICNTDAYSGFKNRWLGRGSGGSATVIYIYIHQLPSKKILHIRAGCKLVYKDEKVNFIHPSLNRHSSNYVVCNSIFVSFRRFKDRSKVSRSPFTWF